MLTKAQINKIKKAISNRTGIDIKISKTQITKSVKYGGNLFTSLSSLGTKLLPYATSAISKAVPALATGAMSALGSLGIDKIFGKGITIPKKYITMLPPFKKEFTKKQINDINKAYQTGKGLKFKPTQKKIEGGLLGTLASIGIPMAISLVSKIFGKGLQVDRQSSKATQNVNVPPPQPPVKTRGDGHYSLYLPPFVGNWGNTIGMGKKSRKGKGLLLGPNSPFNQIPVLGTIL